MPTVRCTQCQLPFPEEGVPFLCPRCGGFFDYDGPPPLDRGQVKEHLPGLWRYRASFDLPDQAPIISLGEGNTPLIPILVADQTIWLKMESQNPTGSYKDRGSAVLLSQLAARGVEEAVEDSSGNAGASFAAYAARAKVRARVFVPASAAGPKRGQIEAYGAGLVCVPGPRSAAAGAVRREADQGAVYASHAYLPFGLAGVATIAYELWEQLGRAPGTVIAPVGHGGLLLGVMRGFRALLQAGLIADLPYYVGVQARACAPVWAGYAGGRAAMQAVAMQAVEEGPTVAEGVRVRHPVRAEAILSELAASAGEMLAIDEAEILPAYHELARAGVHVEPTSALVWAACQQRTRSNRQTGQIPGPICLILSGAGLKYQTKMT